MRLIPLSFASLLMLVCSAGAAAQDTPLQVVVSILPQQYLVERVGGSQVEVLTLVQPGDNEATYSPGPATLAALDSARAWFTMGVPFERNWQGRIQRDRPGLEIVPLAEDLPLRLTEQSAVSLERTRGHRHGGMPDPHTWTDPRLAARMVERIATSLARMDPDGADIYAARAGELRQELYELHDEIAARLAPVQGRAFIVFHPSWGYFADAFGLIQLPIEVGGREPGPRGLAEVIRLGREAGVRAVFVQQQFSQRSALAVAEALDAAVIDADPLALDYIANLRRVSLRMAEALADAAPGTPR